MPSSKKFTIDNVDLGIPPRPPIHATPRWSLVYRSSKPMNTSRCLRHAAGRPTLQVAGRLRLSRGIVTDADVESARKYCVNQLRCVVSSAILSQLTVIDSHLTCHFTDRETTMHTSSANSCRDPPKMPTMPCEPSTSSSRAFPKQYRIPP